MAGAFMASQEEKFQGWKELPRLLRGISAGLSNESTPGASDPEQLHPE